MPVEIRMPALSPTMEEGNLASWNVKEGDTVAAGDVIAEIETDKATMEFEAVDEGTIGKIVVDAGSQGVRVNEVIAILLEDGESANDVEITAPSPDDMAPQSAKQAVPHARTEEPRPQHPKSGNGERIFATPLARRIAAESGIDLTKLAGSGPHGRIIRADVDAAATAQPPKTASSTAGPADLDPPQETSGGAAVETLRKVYEGREFEEISLDGMRKTIAARLSEAKSTIPHFYLRRDIILDELLGFRSDLNARLAARGVKISINDFIIKACALALQDHPTGNAVWAGDRILQMKASDVAVAVAVEGGLFTPVLKDAEIKSLTALSSEMKDLAARARDRKLAPHEFQGGSFAISNLGMMGIENFDAVINPPHAAILAVGAGVRKPIVRDDGALDSATVMSVTLSVDHRVIDGALGAEMLASIKAYLEDPLTMLA